jgi:hypothetical protein
MPFWGASFTQKGDFFRHQPRESAIENRRHWNGRGGGRSSGNRNSFCGSWRQTDGRSGRIWEEWGELTQPVPPSLSLARIFTNLFGEIKKKILVVTLSVWGLSPVNTKGGSRV